MCSFKVEPQDHDPQSNLSEQFEVTRARWLELESRLKDCYAPTPLAIYFNYVGMYLDIDIGTAADIYDIGGFVHPACTEVEEEAAAVAVMLKSVKIRNQCPRPAQPIAYWVDHIIKNIGRGLTADAILSKFEYTGRVSQLHSSFYTDWHEYIDIWAAGRITKEQVAQLMTTSWVYSELDGAWFEFLKTATYDQIMDPYTVRMAKHRALNKVVMTLKAEAR